MLSCYGPQMTHMSASHHKGVWRSDWLRNFSCEAARQKGLETASDCSIKMSTINTTPVKEFPFPNHQ